MGFSSTELTFDLEEMEGGRYGEDFRSDDPRSTTVALGIGIAERPSLSSTAQSSVAQSWIIYDPDEFCWRASEAVRISASASVWYWDAEVHGYVSCDAELMPVISRREVLLDLKHFLSLTTKELADILLVSRQSVYAWVQDETKIRAENFQRVKVLHSLATRWNDAVGKPLPRFLKTAEINGKSLINILSQPIVEGEETNAHVDALIARAKAEPKKVETLIDRARELGFKEMPDWMKEEGLQKAIGRATAEERE